MGHYDLKPSVHQPKLENATQKGLCDSHVFFTFLSLHQHHNGLVYSQQCPPNSLSKEVMHLSVSHGWICAIDLQKHQVHIHNPFTNATRVFQIPPWQTEWLAGLSYDPIAQEYKAVCFRECSGKHQIDILSLQTNELISIECPTLRDYLVAHFKPIAVDGSLNWIAYSKELRQVLLIMRFSLAENQLSFTSLPADEHPRLKRMIRVHTGLLCLYIYGRSGEMNKPDNMVFAIWILEEETLTWNKLASITMEWPRGHLCNVIGLIFEGEHLLMHDPNCPKLIVLDLKQKRYNYLEHKPNITYGPQLVEDQTLSSLLRISEPPKKKKKAWPWSVFRYVFNKKRS